MNGKQFWFNSKEDISAAVQTLQGFLNLNRARREAYNNKIELDKFIIWGTWFLDNCGNCCKVRGSIKPYKMFPDTSPVMTEQECWDFLSSRLGNEKFLNLCFSFNPELPHEHLKCPVCGFGWNIISAIEAVEKNTNETIPLKEYEGKTLGEAEDLLNKRTDAFYRIPRTEYTICNDKYIDLSPEYPAVSNVWEAEIKKNEGGFLKQEIGDSYIIQEGDKASVHVFSYYHYQCYIKDTNERNRRYFEECFNSAGFDTYEVSGTQNEYTKTEKYGCWFNFDTEWGVINIGWRKRVVNIKIEGLLKNIDLQELFPDEKTTKGPKFIHAWTKEKTIKYLSKIRENCK